MCVAAPLEGALVGAFASWRASAVAIVQRILYGSEIMRNCGETRG